MTIADLRAIAAHHVRAAENAFIAAKGMGDCTTATEFTERGAQHLRWADALTQLADAFQTFSTLK